MGASKKLDPSLKIPHPREGAAGSSAAVDDAGRSLDGGSPKDADDSALPLRVTKSNAEIAENVTSTARKSPAPAAARADIGTGIVEPRTLLTKRAGATRQRAPAPSSTVSVPKREAITGQREEKRSGSRSNSSTGGAHPSKASARAGITHGASRAKGADGNTIE